VDATNTETAHTETLQPLTLSEQLDAMLLGWLERHADHQEPGPADRRAAAFVTVAERCVPEVERFCAGWDMTAERTSLSNERRAVLRVDGLLLPVTGFAAITDMYRAARPC
jgi:hypothetical protein